MNSNHNSKSKDHTGTKSAKMSLGFMSLLLHWMLHHNKQEIFFWNIIPDLKISNFRSVFLFVSVSVSVSVIV